MFSSVPNYITQKPELFQSPDVEADILDIEASLRRDEKTKELSECLSDLDRSKTKLGELIKKVEDDGIRKKLEELLEKFDNGDNDGI